jgi:hypothetical protein
VVESSGEGKWAGGGDSSIGRERSEEQVWGI